MLDFLQTFVGYLTTVLFYAIFARVILAWFPTATTANPIVALLYQITEPILAPLRAVIPRIGMMDLSPLVAIIILRVISSAVARLG
jgi:YggT family protein